jgi:hypothetical protein
VVRPRQPILDFDDRERARRSEVQLLDAAVGGVDAVQNRGPQSLAVLHGSGQGQLQRLHGHRGGQLTAAAAPQAVGDDQHGGRVAERYDRE